jgi:hypothetical protein
VAIACTGNPLDPIMYCKVIVHKDDDTNCLLDEFRIRSEALTGFYPRHPTRKLCSTHSNLGSILLTGTWFISAYQFLLKQRVKCASKESISLVAKIPVAFTCWRICPAVAESFNTGSCASKKDQFIRFFLRVELERHAAYSGNVVPCLVLTDRPVPYVQRATFGPQRTNQAPPSIT